MVRFTVSTTQPRTVFTMFQLQLPFRSFFKETGSLRNDESSGPRGLNTWSMVCRSVLRTLRRFGSCAREMKSSTKMSTYCRGSPVVGSDGSRVRGSGTAVFVAGGGRNLPLQALSPPRHVIQVVRRRLVRGGPQPLVRDVSNGLRPRGERRGTVHPSHGKDQRDGNHWVRPRLCGEHHSQPWGVAGVQINSVETVAQVRLVE